MEPGVVTAIGIFGGALVLKFIETFFRRKPVSDEIIAGEVLKVAESTKDDWSDPEFVKAVHKRQMDEAQAMLPSDKRTTCMCMNCVHSRVVRKTRRNVFETNTKTWVKDGWVFKNFKTSLVPAHAHLSIEEVGPPTSGNDRFCYGMFTWTDPDTDKTMALRAVGVRDHRITADAITLRGRRIGPKDKFVPDPYSDKMREADKRRHEELRKKMEQMDKRVKNAVWNND